MKRAAGLLGLCAALTAAAAERAEEFAYAIPLELSGNGALYQLEVPQVVYEGVTRADLADLRVFNGHGENVPHALKPRSPPGRAPAPWVALPFFPLRGAQGTPLESIEVRAERTAAGTIVRIAAGKPGNAASAVLGYLVDSTSFKRPVEALELDWAASAAGFSGALRVEGSNDLQHWHVLVTDAPLVNLEFGGQRLAQRGVELRGARYKYLRLTWPAGQMPFELTRLRGRPADVLLEPSRRWKQVELSAGMQPGEFTFDPGGHFPLDRLRLSLPEANTLASAQVLARNSVDQGWQTVTSAIVYRLTQDGREVQSTDLIVSGSGWQHWLLRIDPRGGGVGSHPPVLEIGWVPQELVFLARGKGPFQLAYGKLGAASADFSIRTLAPGWRSDTELKAGLAGTGPQRVLAGARALEPPREYKPWFLWGSLVLGVLVLAWMAWRLRRELKDAGQQPKNARNGGANGAA